MIQINLAEEIVADYFAYKLFDSYAPWYFVEYGGLFVNKEIKRAYLMGDITPEEYYDKVADAIEVKHADYISNIKIR